jgi:hypothetical protein
VATAFLATAFLAAGFLAVFLTGSFAISALQDTHQ